MHFVVLASHCHIFSKMHKRQLVENKIFPNSNMYGINFVVWDISSMLHWSNCWHRKFENISLCLGKIRIPGFLLLSLTPNILQTFLVCGMDVLYCQDYSMTIDQMMKEENYLLLCLALNLKKLNLALMFLENSFGFYWISFLHENLIFLKLVEKFYSFLG